MRVAVVGGGLAGLTAAHALAAAGAEVKLLEASTRLGGQVWSERVDGFLVEHGAEGFPARRTAIRGLCQQLGLGHRLLEQNAHRNLCLRNGRLEELGPGEAAGILGMAVDPADLGSGLVTLQDGLGELTGALATRLVEMAEVKTASRVERLARDGNGWALRCHGGSDTVADAVILALPAASAADLLAPVVGSLPAFRELSYASSLTVSVAVRSESITLPADATGFVSADPGMFRALTFCSVKFSHRAPEGWSLLRAFFRPGDGAWRQPDEAWVAAALQLLRRILGLREAEPRVWVSRWDKAFVRYPPGFGDQIDGLRERLGGMGQLIELAGAEVDACGVDGAVRSGQAAAAAVIKAAGSRLTAPPLTG